MALVTEQPADLKTTNILAYIPDDVLGPAPATIRMSGKELLVMDTPPEIGEFVKMEITMRCKDDGRTLLADGGISHYRVMSFVAAKVTAEAYKPDPEAVAPHQETDPGLFDENGQIPEDEPEDDGGPEADGDGLDEFRPPFSHNGVAD